VPFMRYGGRPGDVSWSAAYVNLASVLWSIDGDFSQLSLQLPTLLRQLANVQAQASQVKALSHPSPTQVLSLTSL